MKVTDEDQVQTYPEVLFRAIVAIEVLAIALVVVSLLFNAPLEGIADPSHTPNPAKAPWYFLGLQEMLHYFPPLVAGVLVPTLVVIALIVIPYFNINIEAEGLFLKDRSAAHRSSSMWSRLDYHFSCCGLTCTWRWRRLLIVAGFMVLAAHSSPQSASAFPALLAANHFLLDHDLVSVRTGRAHSGWHVLSRPRLVLGVALEKLSGIIGQKPQSSMWQRLFGDPVRAFGVVSLLLLISLAIAPAKNHFSELRHYQKQYLGLIRGRGDAVTLQRHFHDGIQQIWLPELGVVDRCTTCHVGLKEASLADVGTQPFRRHPVIPHTSEQFGCVMCHRGQGAATTVEEAHRSTLAWEQPILPARYVQSSCGQCHRASLAGTPQLNLGRNLLQR